MGSMVTMGIMLKSNSFSGHPKQGSFHGCHPWPP
jgi:hypothetical protein